MYASYSKLSTELKKKKKNWNLSRPSGSWVIDQNNILTSLIYNLKTTRPTKISIPFFSSLDNLLSNAYFTFQKGVDNSKKEHMLISG